MATRGKKRSQKKKITITETTWDGWKRKSHTRSMTVYGEAAELEIEYTGSMPKQITHKKKRRR